MQEMDFKHKIIQWNCRGLKPKFDEISRLLLQHNPSVFWAYTSYSRSRNSPACSLHIY